MGKVIVVVLTILAVASSTVIRKGEKYMVADSRFSFLIKLQQGIYLFRTYMHR